MFVYRLGGMEPATHAVAFENPPADLLERLQPVLAAQGSPAITGTQENGRLMFECDTGEFMLRARVIQALTAAWPDWRVSARRQDRIAYSNAI